LFSFELHLTRLCSLLSVQVFRPAANAPSSGGRHNSFIEALAWLGQTDVKDTSLCISCVEAFATQEERYKALLLQGMTELGEEVFHLPVRIGVPAYTGGLADVVRSPRYATAIGLLLEGRDQYLRAQMSREERAGLSGVAVRMKQWFKANF